MVKLMVNLVVSMAANQGRTGELARSRRVVTWIRSHCSTRGCKITCTCMKKMPKMVRAVAWTT